VVQTTRLNEYDRNQTIMSMLGVLNNIVQFVEMPIKDRKTMIELWHGKFPPELFAALNTLKELGYGANGTGGDNFRVAYEEDGKVYTALIKTTEIACGEEVPMPPMRLSQQFLNNKEMIRKVKGRGWQATAMPLSSDYLSKHLGAQAESFTTWMRDTAVLREEIIDAARVIKDVFTMAKTAGQVKRMVPDLLQYMPEGLRAAYEEQKRASTLPFEWAPYEKERVERMILTVSKGHLLNNMGKPGREDFRVGNLDSMMWGAHGEWAD
jgi:hypothetical protein